jgi:hypothetical protein
MTQDTAPAPAKKVAPRLTVDRFKEAEYTRRVWSMTPAENTEVDHLLKPEYWSLVAAKLNPTDRIEVVAEDNSWFADLLVISAGGNWAKVKLLRHVPLNDSEDDANLGSSQFKVMYGGVKAKHKVVRNADNVVMKDGFPTKAEAIKWMQEYELNALTS